jgi:hypothetical protein
MLCETLIYLRMSLKYVLIDNEVYAYRRKRDVYNGRVIEKILNSGFASLLFSYTYDHEHVVMH